MRVPDTRRIPARHAYRESKARNKKVRAQLAAQGGETDEADEEDEPPKKPTKKKIKGKEKANNSGSSDPKNKSQKKKGAISQEEARRKTLIELFHYRNQVPREELNVLDLDELEKMWAALEASTTSPEKAPATKAPAKSKAKAQAKTPVKKVSAAHPEPDTVEWIGLPMNALIKAQGQSKRADAPTPPPKSRKRDLLTDCDEDAKCARVKPAAQGAKASVVSKPNKPGRKSADHSKKLTALSGSTEREADGEEIDIDVEFHAASEDKSEVEGAKPRKKRGATNKKDRPKSGKYDGVECKILDQAVLETVQILSQRGLCPSLVEFNLYLKEAWDCAILARRKDLKSWVLTREHAACIKG
ncbi:hypothetical protein BDV93DRAFT_561524 [Ceratobasidium sp. AG-I]|nr:hypothetical protein BDV93DRAFT_561524 [Ceratobasidium sp. AG-I]